MVMGNAQVVAVVVTYNRLAKLQDTLARLCASPLSELSQILVYDNASDDGTADWLAAHPDPRVVTVRSEVNCGGAGGFEHGMRAAVARFDPDWLVLMDDDARPAPQTLAAFHASDRSPQDAFAAAVYYPDGEICDMNRPWVNPFAGGRALLRTLIKRRNGFHLSAADYDGPQRTIDGASFVGLFLSRRAIKTAGYPDGKLFIYGDDVLYTLGLSDKGGRIAFDPALKFEHDCAVPNAHAVLTPLWRVYYYHRNQVFVFRAAAGRVLFRPILALRHMQWKRRAAAYGANAETYRKLLSLGVADGKSGNLSRSHGDILALSGEK